MRAETGVALSAFFQSHASRRIKPARRRCEGVACAAEALATLRLDKLFSARVAISRSALAIASSACAYFQAYVRFALNGLYSVLRVSAAWPLVHDLAFAGKQALPRNFEDKWFYFGRKWQRRHALEIASEPWNGGQIVLGWFVVENPSHTRSIISKTSRRPADRRHPQA